MNEPYGRVSQNNGDVTSSLTGAAIGAGLTGSGLIGARAHYNRIDNRTSNQLERAQKQLAKQQGNYDKAFSNFMKFEADGVNRSNTTKFDKAKEAYKKADDALFAREQRVNQLSAPGYADERRAAHLYNKAGGGWKKAGIVGGSALLGGAAGYGINQL